MSITRKQLKEMGATEYLARRLTRNLQSTSKIGRAYTFERRQVLNAIRQLLSSDDKGHPDRARSHAKWAN